ncbi:hypothetical protein ACWF82_01415 [Nocardia sp. NPDC055053]
METRAWQHLVNREFAAADKPEEAADVTLNVVVGGRLVPSHYWRVSEIVSGIDQRDEHSAATVREAFHDTYPG